MSNHFVQGMIFLQQNRLDSAEKELRQALADDPNNPDTLTYLAQCLTDQDKDREAVTFARQAVGLAPQWPPAHFALARALLGVNKLQEARQAAEEALRLDPEEASHYGLLAAVYLAAEQWQKTLEAAEAGLAIDPESNGCINLRATALTKLGRSREAHDAINFALRNQPNNSHTHANRGWLLLHQAETRQALEHFRDALRLDPNNEYAKAGLVEALKTRIFIYRWLLAFFLWMSTLSSSARFGLFFGAYFGYKAVRSAAADNNDLAPYLWPVMVLYLLFVLMTWIGPTLFNVTLLLNPYGRYALSPLERVGGVIVGSLIFTAVMAGCAGYFLSSSILLIFAGFCVIISVPTANLIAHYDEPGRGIRFAFLGVMLASAAGAAVPVLLDLDALFSASLWTFLLTFVAGMWIGAINSLRRPAT